MRSNRIALAPRSVSLTSWAQLLDWSATAAERGQGRVISLGSEEGRPFLAQITWGAGGGNSSVALVSVATGTQVCVFGDHVQVDVQNLHADPQNVRGMIGFGAVATTNVYEVELSSVPTALNIPIPAFARSVLVVPEDVTTPATGRVDFENGNADIIGRGNLAVQPVTGWPVGSASRILVTCSSACRVIFLLSL